VFDRKCVQGRSKNLPVDADSVFDSQLEHNFTLKEYYDIGSCKETYDGNVHVN